MFKGAHLQLYFEKRPVDRTTIETLESVQVRSASDGPAGFQLTFALINHSQVHNQFLFAGSGRNNVREHARITVVLLLNGTQYFLIDGVITNHQVTPNARPGSTKLTLTGEDMMRVMDYSERDGRAFRNQSRASRINRILGEYSGFGVSGTAQSEQHRDTGENTRGVPHQRGTDLQYIRNLAQTSGHVFSLEATGIGRSRAYWGPEFESNEFMPALSIDMGVATNVDSLNLTYDSEQREKSTVTSQRSDDRSEREIQVSDEFAINSATGQSEPPAKRQTRNREAAKFSDARARLEGLATETRSNNAVTAQGSLDTLRYGAILKPRRKVDLRGVTTAFNGTWNIRSVTHRISRGEYKQDFQLVRNSLAPLAPKVKQPPS